MRNTLAIGGLTSFRVFMFYVILDYISTLKRVPIAARCSCCFCAYSWGCCYQIFKLLRLCRFSTDRYETFHTYQQQQQQQHRS